MEVGASNPAHIDGADLPRLDRLVASPDFRDAAARLADKLGRPAEEVRAEAAGQMREMAAWHQPLAREVWNRLGRWLLRGYRFEVDETALRRLCELNRSHPLVWLLSHRSYLDAWAFAELLTGHGMRAYAMGGMNMNFWPFGPLARRNGMVFIRRDVRADPVYRLALRQYVADLVGQRESLVWSIEGGRTRTGKLQPPRYGLLRYVADAAVDAEQEVLLVPVSIVYDQLGEVPAMTAEALGATKSAEGLSWLLRFAKMQKRRLGNAYVTFGEPIPLREQLTKLASDGKGGHEVERVALQVCHGINRVTPATPTALVAMTLLAADRALTLHEVVQVLGPVIDYLERAHHPVAGGADLRTSDQVRGVLDRLAASQVVTRFDQGTDTVWVIAAHQHLVAAFYRNAVIHFFINRAIAELALQRITDGQPDDPGEVAWQEGLRLRELLKFEFFFARKREFAAQMREELALVDPDWQQRLHTESGEGVRRHAREWLRDARPHVAPLVLRPFLDAYLVVANRLAACDPSRPVNEAQLLQECLGVARQWQLQGRLASAESISLELFRTALRLAGHRGLLGGGGDEVLAGRRDLEAELRDTLRRIAAVADVASQTREPTP